MSALTLGPAVMFTPADRPERYATALERADAVILDLEAVSYTHLTLPTTPYV